MKKNRKKMSGPILLLIFLLKFFVLICSSWIQSLNKNYSQDVRAARISYFSGTPQLTMPEFIHQACPSQPASFSCYYHGNASLASDMEKRKWINKQENISEFDPKKFLQFIINRKLYLIGDSMMGQIYVALTCHLNSYTEIIYHNSFTRYKWCNDYTCPGEDNDTRNAFLLGGVGILPEYNSSIIYRNQNTIATNVSSMFINITLHDLTIMNFGLHYSNISLFHPDMKRLAEYLYYRHLNHFQHNHNTSGSSLKPHHHHIYFLETSPQHYNSTSGYYEPQLRTKCVPITNGKLHYSSDWRNRIMEHIFEPLIKRKSISIIPIVKGLLSQYDAHISQLSYNSYTLDCTHWCFPSGIFLYIQTQIFASFLKVIQ